MTQWWRVEPPIDSGFLVLVVNGRIAVAQQHYVLFKIGDRWPDARKALEEAQFVCVMEGGT